MYQRIRNSVYESTRLSREIRATEFALQADKQRVLPASAALRQQFYSHCRQPSTRVSAFLAGFFTGLLPSPSGRRRSSLASSLLAMGLRAALPTLLNADQSQRQASSSD